jgi:hypothetical protein
MKHHFYFLLAIWADKIFGFLGLALFKASALLGSLLYLAKSKKSKKDYKVVIEKEEL